MIRTLVIAVPAGAVQAGEPPNLAREAPPAARVSVAHAIGTGVGWLVANRNRDGGFGTMTSGRPWEVSAHVPGGIHAFRAATTALAYMALARCAP